MKVTRHKDSTVSLRLRRHSFGGGERAMADVVFALGQAALGFETMAHKYPAEAAEYNALAAHYRAMAQDLEMAAQL